MKQKELNRLLSLLMVFCLLVGLFPGIGLTASAAEPDLWDADTPVTANARARIADEQELIKAINTCPNESILYLEGTSIIISKPIVIPEDKSIQLSGLGADKTIIVPSPTGEFPSGSSSLFVISERSKLMLNDLTLNGKEKTRGIVANKDGAEIYLVDVKVMDGSSGAESGGGIHLHGDVELTVRGDCSFSNNKANPVAPTAGGAIYVGPGSKLHLWGTADKPIKFYGNESHSGACIYAYKSHVLANYCEFGILGQGNHAGQRGGAIHCHATMVLQDCTVQENTSDQYGGGIYLSANADDVDGMAVLENTAVINNKATNSGGGIFVASNSSLFLKGATTVTGNHLETVEDSWDSNIHYTSESGKIVICDNEVGAVGISTISPTFRKLAVYSYGTIEASLREELKNRLAGCDYILNAQEDFLLTLSKKFSYDGDAWALMDKKSDTATGYKELDPAKFREGNLWLHLDPEYIHIHTGGSTIVKDQPRVVFDYNLPGMTAIISTHPKGTQLKRADGTWPADPGPTFYMDGVSFTFKGWYTDPRAGSKVDPDTQTITVNSDVVYYAHWDIKPDNPTGGTPAAGKMYLVYFDQNYPGGGFTSAYKVAGSFSFDVEYTFTNPETGDEESGTKTITVSIPWGWPGNPNRYGYQFKGWFTSATGGTEVNKGSWSPSQPTTTLYAQWLANSYPLTWDANGGTGGGNTTQSHDETVKPPTTIPTWIGYNFTGWYLDRSCTIPLTSGTLVTGPATFYAGWAPKEYTITWDAGYTGGAITTVKQYHDEKLNILPAPTREGYKFGGWYKGSTRAESYGTVKEDVTFTARWTNNSQEYTVKVDWNDHSNNDLVRPESITVSLMSNDIPTGLSYTLDASNADSSGNLWLYTFEGLDVTDAVSNPITYSVAITSSVPDEYVYGIQNNSAKEGYILMTHSLITRDVDAYVVWDDAGNQDGLRPSTVTLRLYANGEPVDDGEAKVALSGSGNTWFYRFHDVQKYYTDAAGNKGLEIIYTIKATATNPGELDGYTDDYHDYTAILTHSPATVSRTVHVEWQDNNDQDGKRPASAMVQLYADNVPLEGKVVLLSPANNWTYTWNDLPKYTSSGREVVYSARVSSTLVDYTAKSTGMTIEMTYVPSSTSISAFVTWTDELDADGLRPDYITAQLVADGKPTGDSQVLSATSGWTVSWTGYPIYKDGDRIEYTFEVDVPDGYSADYHGVYDTSGLSAVLTHERLKQSLTGNIAWEDRDNQSGGRMSRVAVYLCANGSVIDEDDKVWISADEDWEHTFSNLPIYQDGGKEIKYSIQLASDPGKYVPTTSKMTITMRLDPEYIDVPFQVIWDDNNDSDRARPNYVSVSLFVDGKPSDTSLSATAQNDWAVLFTHLDRYGANGLYRYTPKLTTVPDGYVAEYPTQSMVVLKRVAQTKDVTAFVTWLDNDDQYRERPERVTLSLYADHLDGNGPQHTGLVERCEAARDWSVTFEDVPAFHGGKNILYSVVASGNLPNYTISYDGLEVFMRHASYQPEVTTDYTAKVVWHDGHNAKTSRPYNILVTLYANGEVYKTQTLTEANLDETGYTWSYDFKKLPTKLDGEEVAYTIGVTEPAHYTAQTDGNTITLTHVQDIPLLLRWADQKNNDGFRPANLTLELYGDSVKTDTAVTLSGGSTSDSWRGSFSQIPVWSEAQMDREIVYTWAFAGNDLAGSGYTVNYNGFAETMVGNESLYPIDIARPGDVADVPVSVVWDDDFDRDGLRPNYLSVELYADDSATGKTRILTGSDEAVSWTDAFAALPVWQDGHRIQYSIRVNNMGEYTANPVPGDPLSVSMAHIPATEEITASVVWDDASNQGGLERFDVSAELLVDGQGSGIIGVLDADNNYRESWGEKYRFHDHGKPYAYSVRVTGQTQIPDDYDITVDGLTITVKRARFLLHGTVRDNGNKIVPTATVTLYGPGEVVLGQVITDSNGQYSFTVTPNKFILLASVYSDGNNSGTARATVTNSDVQADIKLTRSIVRYTISGQVKDNKGRPASGAQVSVVRIGHGVVATITADGQGHYRLENMPKGIYELYATYTYGGESFRSQTVYCSLSADAVRNITVVVREPGVQTNTVFGRVVDKDGKPAQGILVHCYNYAEYPNTMLVETITDANGMYSFKDLPADNYYLKFLNQSGQELLVEAKVTFSVPNTSLDIELPDAELTGEIVTDPNKSGTGLLSGVVLDKDGRPVQGAEIIVVDKSTNDHSEAITTEPNGSFEADLPAGDYTVEVWKPFDNNTDLPIRVDDDASAKGDGVVTADGFTISGDVLDDDGNPMEGVTVYLYGEDGRVIQIGGSQAEEPETNEAQPIPPAPEALLPEVETAPVDEPTAEAESSEEQETMLAAVLDPAILEAVEKTLNEATDEADVEADEEAGEDVVLSDEQENAVELHPDVLHSEEASQIRGNDDSGYVRMDEMQTAADGKYIFTGLPAGRYIVKIARGIGGNGGSTDIPVTVQPLPEIPDGVDLTVTTDSYTVSGVVTDKDGVPVDGAQVSLLDEDGDEVASLTTEADGAYQFGALPEGNYTVNIFYPDSEHLVTGDVTISDGGFTAFPGCAVTGSVKDNKGNALAYVTVTFQGEHASYTATTDKDGLYRVALADGKYTMAASYQGKTAEKTVTVRGQTLKADLTIILSDGGSTTPGDGSGSGGNGSGGTGSDGTGSGGSGSGGGGGSIPAPGPGETIPGEDKTFVLSGTVTNKDGDPVEGANVTATNTKTGKTYADTTGADGKYAIAVPMGSYTISITYGDTQSSSKEDVTVSKDLILDAISMDGLDKLVLAYVKGYPDGTFSGDMRITRSEVAALISRVSETFDEDKSYAVDFRDVPGDAWYLNNLGYCVETGLIQGRGNGYFDPTANITRAEFAAIVARFLDLPNEVIGQVSYTDTAGNWAEGYIAQLTAKGIVEGKGDGKFDPDAAITRYEAVTMLNRMLERTPDKAALDALIANSTIRPFPDLQSEHWAYYQVLEAAFDHYHK